MSSSDITASFQVVGAVKAASVSRSSAEGPTSGGATERQDILIAEGESLRRRWLHFFILIGLLTSSPTHTRINNYPHVSRTQHFPSPQEWLGTQLHPIRQHFHCLMFLESANTILDRCRRASTASWISTYASL